MNKFDINLNLYRSFYYVANLWLNGTLGKYYSDYTGNKNGLNNLIRDFGTVIRSEINPQYPESIYDGGELGYSLGVAYGYALNSNEDIIPCIIGDGEAETGTLCSAWQLNKLLKTKSKVLPIINLNGLKMGSQSFLSRLSNDELIGYYSSLGYQVNIVDGLIDDNVLTVIDSMQNTLANAVLQNSPLIIFKTKKGYTLPKVNSIPFENTLGVHKNPLQIYELDDKFDIIRNFLQHYTVNIFDKNNELNSNFLNFRTSLSKQNSLNVNKIDFDDEKCKGIKSLEAFLIKFIKNNNLKVFSDLGDIIENATLVNQTKETKNRSNINSWNYYFDGLNINNELYHLEFDVRSLDTGENQYRVQRLQKKQTTHSGDVGNNTKILPAFEQSAFSSDNIPQSNNNVNSEILPTINNMQNSEKNTNKILNPNEISKLTKENTKNESEKLAEILREKPITIKEKDNWLRKLATIKFIDKGYYVDKLARKIKNRRNKRKI